MIHATLAALFGPLIKRRSDKRKRDEERRQRRKEAAEDELSLVSRAMSMMECGLSPSDTGLCVKECIHFRHGDVFSWRDSDGTLDYYVNSPKCKLWR